MRSPFLSMLLVAMHLPAQSTKPAIETRLLHQPMYLRGCWHQDKLRFSADGTLLGDSTPTSFTLSGIEVTKLSLAPDHLTLEGRRVGLILDNFTVQRIVLKQGMLSTNDEHIRIEIAAPLAGDYTAALDAIFSDFLALVLKLPPPWQGYARQHLLLHSGLPQPPRPPSSSPSISADPKSDPARRVGGSVTPPKVLNAPEPTFNDEARGVKHAGKCLVYLQVDHEGVPIKVAILHAIGLGRDERAMAAVAAYRFTPAMENGNPVTVEMNVEVNFAIF